MSEVALEQTSSLGVSSNVLLAHDSIKPNKNVEYLNGKSMVSKNSNVVPITLEWKNLNYIVQMKDPKGPKCCGNKISKQILYNMNGTAKSGQLVAIIGPSGSGKTTLLNALAGRIIYHKKSSLTGSITLNGVSKNSLGSKYTRIAAYVQQDDILFSHLTVKETLTTAALFRLPKTMRYNEKIGKVDFLINELGLNDAKNTHIGNARHKGVSGGERKRTNIGIELINDPSLLFLDEPTTGLDAYQALNVVETLKILANSGCTIITSIHQPRSSIVALFDKLIILSQGHMIYQGPAKNPSVLYFNDLGFKCPSFYNPCDYFLDIISVNNRTKLEKENSEKRINYLIESFQYKKDKTIKDFSNIRSNLNELIPITSVRSSIITQFGILTTRNVHEIYRDKFTFIMRISVTIFFACFISMIYSDMNKGQKSLQDRAGLLFFSAIDQSFSVMINTVHAFSPEKGIVMRERQAKSYHLIAYYCSKVLCQIPMNLVFPIVFGSIVYGSTDLHPSYIAYLQFILTLMLIMLAANSIGFFVASVAPNIHVANALAPPIMIVMLLFAGFYINDGNLPFWIGWAKNISSVRWGFISLMVNEFKGVKNFKCDNTGEDDQCFETGNEYLDRNSFGKYTVYSALRNLFTVCVGFHCLAFFALVRNQPKYMSVSDKKNEKNGNNKNNIYTKLNYNQNENGYNTME